MLLQNLPGSVPLGRLFDIPIRLHLLFIFTLCVQLLGSNYYGAWHVLLWFLLLGPVLLSTVLFHRNRALFGFKECGGVVHGILLWPLGGLAFIGHNAGPKKDIWVAVAGPLTHVPCVAFWVAMLFPATKNATGSWHVSLELPSPEGAGLWQALCVGAIIVNLSLFAFNLLVPAYPLDGGRMFVDLLLVAGVAEYTAAKATIGIAVPISVGVIIFGVVIFQMVTILVGCFILFSSYQLWTYVHKGTLLQHPMFCYTEQEQEPFSGLPVSVEAKQPGVGDANIEQGTGRKFNSDVERMNTAPSSSATV